MENFDHQAYETSIKHSFHKSFWLFFLLFFCLVMIIPSVIAYHTDSEPAGVGQPVPGPKQNTSISQKGPDRPLIVGWTSENNSIPQNLADYKNLTVVSPVLASVDNQYHLHVISNASITNTIQKHGKIIWARLVMTTDTNPNVHSFLSNENTTNQVIKSIYQSALQNHWYGVNLDIENVNLADRAAFSGFIKNLASELSKSSIILSIDIPPDSGGNNEQSPFDHKILGKYCDYIVFMGYDQHWATDPVPGPVTSLSWLKENLQELIQTGIPSEKIILGLPAYTRIWQQNRQGNIISDPAEPVQYVQSLIAQNHRKLSWNSDYGEYYASYTVNNVQHKIWLPTEKSFHIYLQLLATYHLAGSAVWNLNLMSSDYWNRIFQK